MYRVRGLDSRLVELSICLLDNGNKNITHNYDLESDLVDLWRFCMQATILGDPQGAATIIPIVHPSFSFLLGFVLQWMIL